MIRVLKIDDLERDLKPMLNLLKDLGIKEYNKLIREILKENSAENRIIVIEKDSKREEIFLASSKNLELILKNIGDEMLSFGLKIGEIRVGKIRKDFIPAREFLEFLLKKSDFKINHLIVNEKSEWLFICKRDLFSKGIAKENRIFGNSFLILNKNKECLGIGRQGFFKNKRIVKNIFDIGDFLRRERAH
ncbi:MAG: hypothetical protein ACP5H9_02740 [Candidatus Woesearchaeota archaeon]